MKRNYFCSRRVCGLDSNLLSSEINSHSADGSEEENNNIKPVLLEEGDDSSIVEHLDEVYHMQEENILPRSLSVSKQDVLQATPRNRTDNILPRLSTSSSSSLVVS